MKVAGYQMGWDLPQPSESARQHFPLWGVITVLAAAVGVGLAIGYEAWLYAVLPLALPIVILRPVESSMGLFALLVPFETIAVVSQSSGPGSSLNWYVGAVSGLVLIGTGIFRGRIAFPPTVALWWVGLMLWGTIVCAWAPDPKLSIARLPTAFGLILLFLAASSLRTTKREVVWVASCALLGGLVSSLYAAIQYYRGIGWFGRASLVLGAHETDPNVFAASQVLPFALALTVLCSARHLSSKLASLSVVLLIAYSILLTMSRGSLLASLVVVLVLLYRYGLNWRVIGALILLPVIALALPNRFFLRLGEAISSHGEGRFDIWRVGLLSFRDWWYCGAGFDNFKVIYGNNAGYAPVFRGMHREAHNIYLGIGVELGIVGLALLLIGALTQLSTARQFIARRGVVRFPIGVACEAACWGMLVMSTSLDTLWLKGFWLTWILLGMSVHACSSEMNEDCATETACLRGRG